MLVFWSFGGEDPPGPGSSRGGLPSPPPTLWLPGAQEKGHLLPDRQRERPDHGPHCSAHHQKQVRKGCLAGPAGTAEAPGLGAQLTAARPPG